MLAEGAELRSYSGVRIGFIWAITDITAHRRLENELLEARRHLERRVQERTAELRAEMAEREKLEKELLEAKEKEQRRFARTCTTVWVRSSRTLFFAPPRSSAI